MKEKDIKAFRPDDGLRSKVKMERELLTIKWACLGCWDICPSLFGDCVNHHNMKPQLCSKDKDRQINTTSSRVLLQAQQNTIHTDN